MEPPNNGQIGASTLVRYSEVSFIGTFSQKSKFLLVELFFLILIMIKRNYISSHTIAIVISMVFPEKDSYVSLLSHGGGGFTIHGWVEVITSIQGTAG